jgi:hypothetical protein
MYFSTALPSIFVQSAATCLQLPQPEILVCIEEDLTLAGFCILLSTGSYRRRHLHRRCQQTMSLLSKGHSA